LFGVAFLEKNGSKDFVFKMNICKSAQARSTYFFVEQGGTWSGFWDRGTKPYNQNS
jgi:hypothetical protein